jgi:hypothetical protein
MRNIYIKHNDRVYKLTTDQFKTFNEILGNIKSYKREEQQKLIARGLRYLKDNCKFITIEKE